MGDSKIDYEGAPARREDQPPSPMKGGLHTESHARIFGLSLGALLAACLVLNATSPSTRHCQQQGPRLWQHQRVCNKPWWRGALWLLMKAAVPNLIPIRHQSELTI